VLRITDSLPPVSQEELREVEASIGYPLPDQYRRFLLSHNGGRPQSVSFRFERKPGEYADSVVHWFYGIKAGSEFFINFERHYRILKDRMPPNIIPIASDPGGNQICISVSGSDAGFVYFWDHERESDPEEDESPSYDNLYPIGTSFNEFLGGLV
jgi:cell wall assembly regulator SMI1